MPDNREPKDAKGARRSLECGYCEATFSTSDDLYDHQRKNHDPDGVMFSDLGLPK